MTSTNNTQTLMLVKKLASNLWISREQGAHSPLLGLHTSHLRGKTLQEACRRSMIWRRSQRNCAMKSAEPPVLTVTLSDSIPSTFACSFCKRLQYLHPLTGKIEPIQNERRIRTGQVLFVSIAFVMTATYNVQKYTSKSFGSRQGESWNSRSVLPSEPHLSRSG